MTALPTPHDAGVWYLEGLADHGRGLRRIPILTLPFRVGRRPDLDLSLSSDRVSQLHAEIFEERRQLRVRDLESTNGTFVDRRRIERAEPIEEGAILHFANLEFRLGRMRPGETQALMGATTAVTRELPELIIDRVRHFHSLLVGRLVTSVLQPIVSLADGQVLGYEVLGRGDLPQLPAGTGELFELAEALGAETQLSRLFRSRAVEDCLPLGGDLTFFFNTHPAELAGHELLASLRQLRQEAPDMRVVLEIHEAALTDPASLRRLRQALEPLAIGLAYDDFGAGRARILELAEAPPDYLKIDRSLIHEIDRAPDSRRRLLQSLAQVAREQDVRLVAEGLETSAEAESCRQIGFEFGQGYLYGMPLPPADLA